MKKGKIFVIASLSILLIILLSNIFTTSISPYLTVSELLEKKEYNKNVQVIGEVIKETIFFDVETGILKFVMTDGRSKLNVWYEGIVSNLENSTEVVVIGKYMEDGIFYAEKVLVKCPSKYAPEGEEGS
jgi:cytochrome c-type biogenesis protein CcmE